MPTITTRRNYKMAKKSKKYVEALGKIDRTKLYESKEALALVSEIATAKFDETVEAHIKLGVDSRHADQQVRGAIVLPHGTGKTKKVLVFAKGEKAKEAEAAGADFVGAEDLVQKIQKENWFDFDVVVATPDMMGVVPVSGSCPGRRPAAGGRPRRRWPRQRHPRPPRRTAGRSPSLRARRRWP